VLLVSARLQISSLDTPTAWQHTGRNCRSIRWDPGALCFGYVHHLCDILTTSCHPIRYTPTIRCNHRQDERRRKRVELKARDEQQLAADVARHEANESSVLAKATHWWRQQVLAVR
jgi:hypothetical protein